MKTINHYNSRGRLIRSEVVKPRWNRSKKDPVWFLNSNQLMQVFNASKSLHSNVLQARQNFRTNSNPNLMKEKAIEEEIYKKAMRIKAFRTKRNQERQQYGRRSRNPMNYVTYALTNNKNFLRVHPSQESNRAKMKRLIEIYTNPRVLTHNLRHPLTNRNKIMFGVNSLNGNQIFSLLKNYQSKLRFKIPLPQRKPNRPTNNVNKAYAQLMRINNPVSLLRNEDYQRRKLSIWPYKKIPLLAAYAIKYSGNKLNNINFTYFRKTKKIDPNLKRRTIAARNSVNWWNSRRRVSDPNNLANAMIRLSTIPPGNKQRNKQKYLNM